MTHLYKRVARNHAGRDIIAGDVHGHFSKLRQALDAINFNPTVGDRLFFVGDLVDRGPESLEATDWLALPYVHAVRGNHEQMAVDHAAGLSDPEVYIANGGAWFLGLTVPEQREIAATFEALPLAIELETENGMVGIVHAECPIERFADLETDLDKDAMCSWSIAENLIWSRAPLMGVRADHVQDVLAVVVGHTPRRYVTTIGNHIYIDTQAWRGGEFTLLDAATLQPAR